MNQPKNQTIKQRWQQLPEKLRIFLVDWVFTLGVAFLVAFFFRTTIASPRHIPTGSMIPTIKIGEFIFVGMFEYDWHIPFTRKSFSKREDPKRGEVVVFEYPLDADKDYIKRVIAVPGDTVEVKNKRIILNGTPLPLEEVKEREILEDLVPKYDPQNITLFRETIDEKVHYVMHLQDRWAMDMPPTEVPADSFFVMGDNRDDSQDSRYWGFVPREKLLGKAGFIWFSFDIHHFPFVRGSRLFTMVR